MNRLDKRLGWMTLGMLVLTWGTACGGEDRPGEINPNAGAGGKGGNGATGATGGTAGSGGSDPSAPVVLITSPEAATDPDTDLVVIGEQTLVTCVASKSVATGAVDVDPSSVKLAVLDPEGKAVEEKAGTPTTNEDEYEAAFVLSDVPNGPVSFKCTASDTSTPVKMGSHTVDTFVDHGPKITLTKPEKDKGYALSGPVPFEFEVAPDLLAEGDTEAAVKSVKFTVSGVELEPKPNPNVPNGYLFSVDFNDTTVFPQAPTGSVPVQIQATNSRTPDPATRNYLSHFGLDGTGPVITVKSHKNQDIIGGKETLSFDVVDPISGVDTKTVSVKLNQDEYLNGVAGEWVVVGDTYNFTFDSLAITGSVSQVTINIAATDKAGNKSPGASLILYLDNEAPIVDLDPGNVRVKRKVGNTIQCSTSFDPLGMAANDLQDVQPFTVFRALVWDRTNYISGQPVLYYSLTDQSKVNLYLQPDWSTTPLLINNDSDPDCDALNIAPNGVALKFLNLEKVLPAGQAFFTAGEKDVVPAMGSECVEGPELTEPNKLCMNPSGDLTHVIRHDVSTIEPVVYGIGQMTGLECTGSGWEIGSQLSEATNKQGWFCLAASAVDKVGNVGISRPLRVCYDNPNVPGVPPCALMSEVPPSCTDGCDLPDTFGPTILGLH